jgi:hypothetical protein
MLARHVWCAKKRRQKRSENNVNMLNSVKQVCWKMSAEKETRSPIWNVRLLHKLYNNIQ